MDEDEKVKRAIENAQKSKTVPLDLFNSPNNQNIDTKIVKEVRKNLTEDEIIEELRREITPKLRPQMSVTTGDAWKKSLNIVTLDKTNWGIFWTDDENNEFNVKVSDNNVHILRDIIEGYPIGTKVAFKEIYAQLIEKYGIADKINVENFKGAREDRDKYYNPFLLQPILILEYLRVLDYTSRWVRRLK